MKYEIIDAKPYHVGRIVRKLRAEHTQSLADIGLDQNAVHRELQILFNESSFRKAWVIDGNLAALGGVTGGLLSPHGFVWLALSQDVLKYPHAIIREAKRQLRQIMTTKTELATTVLCSDEVALRFASFLGFHTGHDGQEPKKLAAGKGFAVAMGFHSCA